MSLTVTQRPFQTISGRSAKWNAVGNPILYKMQRKDFTFTQVNNSGGNIQLQFNSQNIASSFAVNDSVYVQSDNGRYDATGLVTVSTFTTPHTYVTIAITYTGTAPGGFANNDTLRTSYRVEVEVYNGSDTLLTTDPFTFAPNSKGAATIDIAAILRAQLIPDTEAVLTNEDLNRTNHANGAIKFYIKYRELWTGSANAQTNDSTQQFFAVLGAMQIPTTYGGNLNDYVLYDDSVDSAKWLTKLTKPVMWRAYPFLLSTIVDGGLNDWINLQVYNGSVYNSALGISYGQLVDWHFAWVNQNFLTTVSKVFANVREQEYNIDYTIEIEIELRDACDNPVLLLGRNTLGGALMWMFDVDQEYEFDYGNGVKNKRQVLHAKNLTINQWEALQDFITLGEVYRDTITEFTSSTIKTSSRIGQQIYVVDQDGTKTGVIVIPTKNKTRTRRNRHDFEIEIEYPDVFV